jgi:integrase/recombinase XerD
MSSPLVTIYRRHSPGCKYVGDEFCKRCNCRLHLRWTKDRKQYRQKAGTRSWAEAEEAKRNLEAQLSGKSVSAELLPTGQTIAQAIDVFTQDKKNQGVSPSVAGKYTRELARLRTFCEARMVFMVSGLTRELLTGYAATWANDYKASTTRSKVRERLKTFLRYCFEAEWLARLPKLSPVKVDQVPTLPLTTDEYNRVLNAVAKKFAKEPKRAERFRALIQLMRWSGLAIMDASTLKRSEVIHDKSKGIYRIVTARQKTGTHVSVPIPTNVAEEILAVMNGNATYVFWSGNGNEESQTKLWAKHIARLFDDAKINGSHMRSHRLRDTFAVDLLEKGVPLEEVSKLLGHESIKTTERSYAKWVNGRQDRLDSLVTSTWKT